jgi:hypothetical protein
MITLSGTFKACRSCDQTGLVLGEHPRRTDAGVLRRRRASAAGHDAEVRCGINRAPVDDHPEIQVRPVSEAGAPHDRNPFAAIDRFAALCHQRRDQAKMAVNANETLVLDQDLKASDTVSLNSDHGPGCDRGNRTTYRREEVDPVVKCPGQWPVRQDTRPKW